MKKQPKCKSTSKVGEINKLCKEKEEMGKTINQVIEKFDLSKKISVLNELKKRGFKIAELLVILIVLPFFKVRIDNMHQKKRSPEHSKAKKDAFYDLKNNELINWRLILLLIVRQFVGLTISDKKSGKPTAFVVDDTLVTKTGLHIENVSKVHDHTQIGLYFFGFKILVLGYFDGISFIPVDFSIHREKGHGSEKELNAQKKALTKLNHIKVELEKIKAELKKKKEARKVIKKQQQSEKSAKKALEQNQKQIEKLEAKQKEIKKEVVAQSKVYEKEYAAYKKSLKQHPAFGLTPKQRKAQFKKTRNKNSEGFKRAQEVDSKKNENALKMLERAIKSGIEAQYFIADSWFFNAHMVQGVYNLSKSMYYLGMVSLRKTIHYLYNGTKMDGKKLLQMHRNNAQRCRKYRSKYIQLTVVFAGLPMQLFFVKMGRAKKWKLLATTDMSLNFIKLFELYQIRWSIEVFFKECKQYLGLGKCQSQDFDAQICSTTLTMIQFILLCYYKRIHYQQKIDGLFEEISYQTMESSIVEKMIAQFIELLDIVAELIEVEPIELYMMLMRNPKATKIIKKLKLDNFLELRQAA